MLRRAFAAALAAALLSLPSLPAPAAEAPRLAVASFLAADPALGAQLADLIAADMARSGKLVMVDRAKLADIIKEQKFQQSSLADPAQAAKLGQLAGANRLLVGTVSVQGDQVVIAAKLDDVTTGTVATSETITGSTSDIFHLTHQLASSLHRKLTGEYLPPVMTGQDAKLGFLEQLDPAKWAKNPASPLRVTLSTNKGAGGRFKGEETLVVAFKVEVADAKAWGSGEKCYVTVYNIDAKGKVFLLFPNPWAQENLVPIGKEIRIPDDTYELGFTGDPGEERFIAVASKQPLEVVEGMKEKLKKGEILELPGGAGVQERGVAPKMKALKPTDWGSGQVHIYRD